MRKITREKVMKLLYTMDVYRQISQTDSLKEYLKSDIAIELLAQQKIFLLNDKDDVAYFNATFSGIIDNLTEIDAKIQSHCKKTWTIAQFGYLERALIRIAVYELLWSEQEGLSPKVVIASTLSLAEEFVDEKSIKFLHGILGSIVNNTEQKPVTTAKKVTGYQKVDTKHAKNNIAQLKKFKQLKRQEKLKKIREQEAEVTE